MDALVSEKESLLSENDLLRYQLKLLKAKRFGRLSEKLNSQIEQLELWIEENELTCAEAVANKLYQNQDHPEAEITEAGCWSHTRRKFYEITVVYDKASIAVSILEQISKMYKIESEIRGLDPGERMKYRQQKSKELVEKLFNDFRKYKKDLPAKSPTAKAINYALNALNNETALRRF